MKKLNTAKKTIIAFLSTVILLTALFFFFFTIEPRQKVSEETIRNFSDPYHAARLILSKTGKSAVKRAIIAPSRTRRCILLELRAQTITPFEINKLLDEVSHTGSMLIIDMPAYYYKTGKDPLLQSLGIAVNEDISSAVKQGKKTRRFRLDPGFDYGSEFAQLAARKKTLELVYTEGAGITFNTGISRVFGSIHHSKDPDYFTYAHFTHGRGTIAIINTGGIFKNHYILKKDNALFLYYLLESSDIDRIEFMLLSRYPPVVVLLLTYGWPFLATLTVLLILFVFWQAPPFGPRLSINDKTRRSRLEHVRAKGHNLTKGGHAGLLAESYRKYMYNKVERRNPALQTMTEEEKTAYLTSGDSGLCEQSARNLIQPVNQSAPFSYRGLARYIQNINKTGRIP